MAKKKEQADMPAQLEAKTKPVRLDLPEDLHRKLRAVAGLNNTTMTGYARDAVEKVVEEELKRRGISL